MSMSMSMSVMALFGRVSYLVFFLSLSLSLSIPLITCDNNNDIRILTPPKPGTTPISLRDQLASQSQSGGRATTNSVCDAFSPESSSSSSSSCTVTQASSSSSSSSSIIVFDLQRSTLYNHTGTNSTGDAHLTSIDEVTSDANIDDTIQVYQKASQQQLLGCALDQFWAEIKVDGEYYRVTIDTTQASLMLASSDCINCNTTVSYPSTPIPNRIDQRVGQTLSNGRAWSGYTVRSLVRWHTLPESSVTFVAITNQTNMFANTRCDGRNITRKTPALNNQGILGMGYPSQLIGRTTSYVSSIINATVGGSVAVPNTNFAIQLCLNTGKLWLGGSDMNFYVEPPAYTPLLSNDFYTIAFQSVYVGADSVDLSSDLWGQIILDTGNSGIELPLAIFLQITGMLNADANFKAAFGSNFFTAGVCQRPNTGVDADTLNQLLPELRFILPAELPTSTNLRPNRTALILSPISSYIREFITASGSKLYCPGLIRSMNASRTTLGWGFLNQFTTLFEPEMKRVGFARTINCGPFATKNEFVRDNIPVPPPTTSTPIPLLLILAILFGVLALLIVLSVGTYCYRRRSHSHSSHHPSSMNKMRRDSTPIFDNPLVSGALDLKPTMKKPSPPEMSMHMTAHSEPHLKLPGQSENGSPMSKPMDGSLSMEHGSYMPELNSNNRITKSDMHPSPVFHGVTTPTPSQSKRDTRISTWSTRHQTSESLSTTSTGAPKNPNWTVHRDSTSNCPYWYNPETGVSSWTRPAGAPSASSASNTPHASIHGIRTKADSDIGFASGAISIVNTAASHGHHQIRPSDGEMESNPLFLMMQQQGLTQENIQQTLQLPSYNTRSMSNHSEYDTHTHTNIHIISATTPRLAGIPASAGVPREHFASVSHVDVDGVSSHSHSHSLSLRTTHSQVRLSPRTAAVSDSNNGMAWNENPLAEGEGEGQMKQSMSRASQARNGYQR